MRIKRRPYKLKNIRNTVKLILIDDEMARSSDDHLYIEVIRRLHPKLLNMPLAEAFKQDDIPYYESVRRSRQWLQQKFPELCGSDEVEAMRVVNEQEFKDFARSFK